MKMKRLPQEAIMTRLLSENKVGKKTIDELAKTIAHFHSTAQSSSAINEFGSLKLIKVNWDENFSQTKKYVDKTIEKADFQFLERKVGVFMEANNALFEGQGQRRQD